MNFPRDRRTKVPCREIRSEAMVEHLSPLDTILPILLGWLLGVLTPGIAESIRRPYRRRDLTRAVVDEMLGLQHTMAWVVYKTRSRRGDLSDAVLDRILPIVESDNGPDRSEEIIKAMREVRKEPEGQRNSLNQALRKPNAGFTLKKYDIPLFGTQCRISPSVDPTSRGAC